MRINQCTATQKLEIIELEIIEIILKKAPFHNEAFLVINPLNKGKVDYFCLRPKSIFSCKVALKTSSGLSLSLNTTLLPFI